MNRLLYISPSRFISALQVADEYDVVDSEIVRKLPAGPPVITADILLAAEGIAKGGHALDPRHDMHSVDSIQAHLTLRDFMDTLRPSEVDTGGRSALTQRNRPLFAKHLDHYLTHLVKQKNEKT